MGAGAATHFIFVGVATLHMMFGRTPTVEKIREMREAGETRKVLEASAKRLRRHPRELELYDMRLGIFRDMGEWEQAVREAHTAAKYDENHKGQWFAVAGDIYVEFSMYEEALAEFDECKRVAPDLPSGAANRCIALRRMRRTDQALREINSVITRWPMFGRPHAIKGDILIDMGENEKAMQCYELAVHLDPNDAYSRKQRDILLVQENQESTIVSRE